MGFSRRRAVGPASLLPLGQPDVDLLFANRYWLSQGPLHPLSKVTGKRDVNRGTEPLRYSVLPRGEIRICAWTNLQEGGEGWGDRRDSNPRQPDPQSGA